MFLNLLYGGIEYQAVNFKKLEKNNVLKFLNEVKDFISSQGYTAWITGRAAYAIEKTNDLDIWLTGQIFDLIALEYLFDLLYSTAIQHNIVLDLKWVENTNTKDLIENKLVTKDVNFIMYNNFEIRENGALKYHFDYRNKLGYINITDNLCLGNFIYKGNWKSHTLDSAFKYGPNYCVQLEEFVTDNNLNK